MLLTCSGGNSRLKKPTHEKLLLQCQGDDKATSAGVADAGESYGRASSALPGKEPNGAGTLGQEEDGWKTRLASVEKRLRRTDTACQALASIIGAPPLSLNTNKIKAIKKTSKKKKLAPKRIPALESRSQLAQRDPSIAAYY